MGFDPLAAKLESPGATARSVAEALAQSFVSIVAIDERRRIVVANEAIGRLVGHRPAELEGRACSDVLDGWDLFGNRYCVPGCPVVRKRRAELPIRPFQRFVTAAGGTPPRAHPPAVAPSRSSS